MPNLYDCPLAAKRHKERTNMATSARNACQKEQLEKYMNTLEKQQRRENSLMLFKQRKFVSRQEKILGKVFQTFPNQRENLKQKEMAFYNELLYRKMKVEKERKRPDSEAEIGARIVDNIHLECLQERRVLSACGNLNHHTEKERKPEKEVKLLSIAFDEVLEKSQRKDSKIDLLVEERGTGLNSVEEDFKEIQQRKEEVGEVLNKEKHDEHESLSLPEIVPVNNIADGNNCLDDTLCDSKARKKTKKSKKSLKGKKRTHLKQRTTNSFSQSTSLPDVRTKTSRINGEPKLVKNTKNTKNEANLALPRVVRKPSEVKRDNNEGTVNLSVVCRVIRIKNNLTKRRRMKKEHKQKSEEKSEEISEEVWESLKNCRYLRVTDREYTPQQIFSGI